MPRRKDTDSKLLFGTKEIDSSAIGQPRCAYCSDKNVHCAGGSATKHEDMRKAHHGLWRYGTCWSCSSQLGCSRCAGPKDGVICQRCFACGTKETFAQIGPLSNAPGMVHKRGGVKSPEYREYPAEFRLHYRKVNGTEEIPKLPPDWREQLRNAVKGVPHLDAQDYEGEGVFEGATPASSEQRRREQERKELLRRQLRQLG